MEVFRPNNTNAIAATATSQVRLFPTPSVGDCAAFYNDGPNVVFVVTGAAAVVATLPALSAAAGLQGNATPIPVGASVSLMHLKGAVAWAAICPAAGTANVYCTTGSGL